MTDSTKGGKSEPIMEADARAALTSDPSPTPPVETKEWMQWFKDNPTSPWAAPEPSHIPAALSPDPTPSAETGEKGNV